MQKELIIARLQATIEMLKYKIKPSEFIFKSYIYAFDLIKECGTTCCVAGWYPKYFPESRLIYKKRPGGFIALDSSITLEHEDYEDEIKKTLSLYHGLDIETIEYLFYPVYEGFDSSESFFWELPVLNENADLSKLIEAWEKFLSIFANSEKFDFLTNL